MHGRACKQCIFRSYNIYISAIRFDENPFTCQCEKEDKKAYGSQISHFYESFLNDIIAVKGLKVLHDTRAVSVLWLGRTVRTSGGLTSPSLT